LQYGDWYDADLETRFGERKNLEPGIPQLLYDFDAIFLKSIPSQHEALQKALEMLTEKHPGRPIVLVNEGFFWGGLPFTRNARGIKPTATLGIGIIPMVLSSIDTAPAGRGFPPDSSPEGRERNTAGNEHVKNQIFALPQKTFRESFKAVEADARSIGMLDAPYISMSTPELFVFIFASSASPNIPFCILLSPHILETQWILHVV
jgi:hypothetical protein